MNPTRSIFLLAIPNIISNISIPLLGMVDTFLMGHMPHAEVYIGAVGIATAIFNAIYWGFGFLRMGTTGLTAQAFGSGNKTEVSAIMGRGVMVALGGALLVMLIQVPIEWAGMYLMEGSEQAKALARDYFYVRIFAAPATLMLYVFHGWFLGMQNAVIPMILSIGVNVVNIAGSAFFVFGMDMETRGIALGTVVAQYAGALSAVVIFLIKYKEFVALIDLKAILNRSRLVPFFRVNFDIMIRTFCLIFVFNFFISRSGAHGDDYLAANLLLLQLLYIMSYITDGFAFAAESLVGKHIGAGNAPVLKETIRGIFYWGMGFAVLFSLAYLFGGEAVLGLLTNKTEIVSLADGFMTWMVLMPIWGTYTFIWDGIFLGAAASAAMRNSMLLSAFLVFLPSWLITKDILGHHSIWFSMTLFMIARGISLALYSRKSIFQNKSL